MHYASKFTIGQKEVGPDAPTYFIADVASSHDGDLSRAKDLIWLAKEAGADCVKFQHFLADEIVSDYGFRALGGQMAHQAAWKKSVYEMYRQHQTPREWTPELLDEASKAGIDFMTTPYDRAAVDLFEPHLGAFKIGSGDITWPDFLAYVAAKDKPIFLATGAATMADVERAVSAILAETPKLCLMQCNTNYTGDPGNIAAVNLNVLRTYAQAYPGLPLGLSDHTPGHTTVLGAVALGARAIEKHFTDDPTRDGPDHGFSMTPNTWREMMERTRELEAALGDGVKRIEENETESVIVQQRALRLTRDAAAGEVLQSADIKALRPAPAGAFKPYETEQILGRPLKRAKEAGDVLCPEDFH